MADLFEIYQENLKTVFGRTAKLLESLPLLSTEKAESAINDADSNIKEAERLLKNMEIQVMTSDPKTGDPNSGIYINNYKTGIDQYKKRILKAKETFFNSKKHDSLVLSTDVSTTSSRREKLISNAEETAWGTFEKLEKAKRATIEMESVSVDIMKEMNNQTDKMKTVGVKVGEMNGQISTSSSLISRMMARQHRNKVIILLFSLGLIMTFCVILYLKLFGSNSSGASSGSGNTTASSLPIIPD